jgi:tetratricopeptide (TPR) repeat protein
LYAGEVRKQSGRAAESGEMGGKADVAIQRARTLNPKSGKAYLAEALLLGHNAPAQVELLEKAVAAEPDSAMLHVRLSQFLASVGRQGDALRHAENAVALDPLSSDTRRFYILTLLHSGRLALAQEEIAKAKKVWINDDQIAVVEGRMAIRYGDPVAAERLMAKALGFDEQALTIFRAYLRARQNPTATNVSMAVAAFRQMAEANPPYVNLYLLSLGRFARVDEAFRVLADPRFEQFIDTDTLFRPEFRSPRQDPRFIAAVAGRGLVDYWHSSGHWPDFARNQGCGTNAGKRRRNT